MLAVLHKDFQNSELDQTVQIGQHIPKRMTEKIAKDTGIVVK